MLDMDVEGACDHGVKNRRGSESPSNECSESISSYRFRILIFLQRRIFLSTPVSVLICDFGRDRAALPLLVACG